MKFEVEIRAKIKDKQILVEKIVELGGKQVSQHSYFNTYHGRELFEEKDVQIRVSDAYFPNEKLWRQYICYKGPELGKGANIREELQEVFSETEGPSKVLNLLGIKNTKLTNTYEIRSLLDNCGFKYFMMMVGHGEEKYKLPNGTELKLMQLDQLGLQLLEVERIAGRKEKVAQVRDQLWSLLEDLGIPKWDSVREEPVQLVYKHFYAR